MWPFKKKVKPTTAYIPDEYRLYLKTEEGTVFSHPTKFEFHFCARTIGEEYISGKKYSTECKDGFTYGITVVGYKIEKKEM